MWRGLARHESRRPVQVEPKIRGRRRVGMTPLSHGAPRLREGVTTGPTSDLRGPTAPWRRASPPDGRRVLVERPGGEIDQVLAGQADVAQFIFGKAGKLRRACAAPRSRAPATTGRASDLAPRTDSSERWFRPSSGQVAAKPVIELSFGQNDPVRRQGRRCVSGSSR